MGAIWAPIMYLEIITFPGLFQFYLGDPHILEFIFIVIEFYQYGTYKGLIRAKKPIWGPCRTQMGLMPRICPYGSHIYMFAGRILPIWDLYGSYMGKKSLYGAHVGPEWDKCPDSAHMGHIYTCLLGFDLLHKLLTLPKYSLFLRIYEPKTTK